jgi:hypothetical protein
MQWITAWIKANWPAVVVIGAGFLMSVALAFTSLHFLLANIIPDDAFYYFKLAQNILKGLGPTFDGIHQTNGFHPLWLVTILPFFHFITSGSLQDIAPIRAILVFSALLNAFLGFVMLAIISRYTKNQWVKALALATWFFNPFNVYEMASGLETPLSMLLLALFIYCAIRISEFESKRGLIIVGIAGAFMMLARLDNIFYFVFFLCWLLYRDGIINGFYKTLWVGIPATIVVLPWLIWNWVRFGMLFTSSSLATTLVNHALIVQDHGPGILQQLKAAVYTTDRELRRVAVQTGAPSVFLILLGVALGRIWSNAPSVRLPRQISLEWFLFGGFILDFMVNASIRWSVRTWYFIPLNIFIVLGLAWLLEKLREGGNVKAWFVIPVCILTLGLFFINWNRNLQNVSESQVVHLRMAEWLDQNVPANAIVGIFNAGIVGYFSNHPVDDIDGLVDTQAERALEARQLWQYIIDNKITYVSDWDVYFNYRYKSFFGTPNYMSHLKLIHTEGEGMRVYQVQ